MENITNVSGSCQDDGVVNFLLIWLHTIMMVTLATTTVTVNLIVIIMFMMEKSLRRCKNTYIASLAVADFLVGCSMPFYMTENLDYRWTLHGLPCRFYLAFRSAFLNVSVLSVLLISVDRWRSVHYPLSYRTKQRKQKAALVVTLCWFFSFAFHAPPILFWEEMAKVLRSPDSCHCDVPFRSNATFMSFRIVCVYVLPVLVVWMLNCSIFWKICRRKQVNIRRSLSTCSYLQRSFPKETEQMLSTNSSDGGCFTDTLALKPRNGHLSARRHSLAGVTHAPTRLSPCRHTPPLSHLHRRRSFDTRALGPGGTNQVLMSLRRTSVMNHVTLSHPKGNNYSRRNSENPVKDLLSKQDRKAAFFLGLLVIVCSICWTPFLVCRVMDAWCDMCLPNWTRYVFLWVVMTNSAINPFLYGLINSEFRKVIKTKLLSVKPQRYRVREAIAYWAQALAGDLQSSRENSPQRSESGSLLP